MNWNIGDEGRAWDAEEAHEKYALAPEKIEMIGGRLLWTEEERLSFLGLHLGAVTLRTRASDPRLGRRYLRLRRPLALRPNSL